MSNNFVQNIEGFPDVDYEWGQDDNYQGFVNTAVEEKMREEYYTNAVGDTPDCKVSTDSLRVTKNGVETTISMAQALEDGYVTCDDVCESAKNSLGCDTPTTKEDRKAKVGSWITNFLAGTGLYRPVAPYNPNTPYSPLPPGGLLYGCTNPDALNYNPMANQDDGTCDIQKGLSPLAWAGIAVGGILLIIGVVALTSGGGGGGGKSRRRKSTTRRRRGKSAYSRRPRSEKIVVNLED